MRKNNFSPAILPGTCLNWCILTKINVLLKVSIIYAINIPNKIMEYLQTDRTQGQLDCVSNVTMKNNYNKKEIINGCNL